MSPELLKVAFAFAIALAVVGFCVALLAAIILWVRRRR